MIGIVLLCCGGRDYTDSRTIDHTLKAIHLKHQINLLIQGGARGADSICERWAKLNGVHTARVDALWDFYHLGAGRRRNRAMLFLKPDMFVAFPGGNGTQDMINIAVAAGIPRHVHVMVPETVYE
jgi:hypothetical protein